MLNRKVNIAVLVSGGGTNLQAILDYFDKNPSDVCQIRVVLSNNPKAFALTRAKNANIEAICIDKKGEGLTREQFEQRLLNVLKECQADLIVLAGFLCVLSKDFCKAYQNRIINVHPSLIPKYCGDGMYGLKVHEAVLAAKETVSGATVHFVNEITDGGQIIYQKEVAVMPDDTPETLQKRVMQQAEWVLLPKATLKISQMIFEGLL